MEPKETAKELVEKYAGIKVIHNYSTMSLRGLSREECIQCAKIAVDEILNLPKIIGLGTMKPIIGEDYKYWQEVKNELNKM